MSILSFPFPSSFICLKVWMSTTQMVVASIVWMARTLSWRQTCLLVTLHLGFRVTAGLVNIFFSFIYYVSIAHCSVIHRAKLNFLEFENLISWNLKEVSIMLLKAFEWNGGIKDSFVDASTCKGSKGSPNNFNKTIQPTNRSTHPGREVSPARDCILLEWTEHCYPNNKSCFVCIQNSPYDLSC